MSPIFTSKLLEMNYNISLLKMKYKPNVPVLVTSRVLDKAM